MPSATFILRGDRDLIRKLERLSGSAQRKIVRPAVSVALTPIVKLAKQKAPKRTKTLAKSIGKKVKSYPRRGTVFGAVGPRSGFATTVDGKPYDPVHTAHLVEYGVAPHLIKGIQHPGTPPRPFMRPAWHAGRPTAERVLISRVRANLEKEARRR